MTPDSFDTRARPPVTNTSSAIHRLDPADGSRRLVIPAVPPQGAVLPACWKPISTGWGVTA